MAIPKKEKITAALDLSGLAMEDANKKLAEVMRDIDNVKEKVAKIQESVNANIKTHLAQNEGLKLNKGKGKQADAAPENTNRGPRRS